MKILLVFIVVFFVGIVTVLAKIDLKKMMHILFRKTKFIHHSDYNWDYEPKTEDITEDKIENVV